MEQEQYYLILSYYIITSYFESFDQDHQKIEGESSLGLIEYSQALNEVHNHN